MRCLRRISSPENIDLLENWNSKITSATFKGWKLNSSFFSQEWLNHVENFVLEFRKMVCVQYFVNFGKTREKKNEKQPFLTLMNIFRKRGYIFVSFKEPSNYCYLARMYADVYLSSYLKKIHFVNDASFRRHQKISTPICWELVKCF